jgi:hypothetical protein
MKLVIDEVEYNIPDRLNLKKWSVLSNWSFIETNYDMLIHHSIGIPLKDCERIPLDTKMLAVSIISVLMYPNCEGLKLKLKKGIKSYLMQTMNPLLSKKRIGYHLSIYGGKFL